MIESLEKDIGEVVEVSWNEMFSTQPFDIRLLDLKCLKHTKQFIFDQS